MPRPFHHVQIVDIYTGGARTYEKSKSLSNARSNAPSGYESTIHRASVLNINMVLPFMAIDYTWLSVLANSAQTL